jgi:hypothetical protein
MSSFARRADDFPRIGNIMAAIFQALEQPGPDFPWLRRIRAQTERKPQRIGMVIIGMVLQKSSSTSLMVKLDAKHRLAHVVHGLVHVAHKMNRACTILLHASGRT